MNHVTSFQLVIFWYKEKGFDFGPQSMPSLSGSSGDPRLYKAAILAFWAASLGRRFFENKLDFCNVMSGYGPDHFSSFWNWQWLSIIIVWRAKFFNIIEDQANVFVPVIPFIRIYFCHYQFLKRYRRLKWISSVLNTCCGHSTLNVTVTWSIGRGGSWKWPYDEKCVPRLASPLDIVSTIREQS